MKKIVIVLLLCFSLTACGNKDEPFSCDSIKGNSDASTDTILLTYCFDSDALGFGLRNGNGEYILPPIYKNIDLGVTTYTYAFNRIYVFEDDIKYLRVSIKNDDEVLANIYSIDEGFILDKNYSNIYIDHDNNVAYYTDDLSYYKIDLISKEISTISYKVKQVTSGYFIFEEEDFIYFHSKDKIVKVDNIQADISFIDSDYYLYRLDDTYYFSQISTEKVVYQTDLEERYDSTYVDATVTQIDDDYLMGICYAYGTCYEYHKMLSGESLTTEGSDYAYSNNEYVLLQKDETISMYDLDFNLIETFDQVLYVLNGENLVIKNETEIVMYNLISELEIPVGSVGYYLQGSRNFNDNIFSVTIDGLTKIYDTRLNLLAESTSINIRWFKVEDNLLFIVDDKSNLTTYIDNVIVHEVDTKRGTLSKTEFYSLYLRYGLDNLHIYIKDDEIIVLKLQNSD